MRQGESVRSEDTRKETMKKEYNAVAALRLESKRLWAILEDELAAHYANHFILDVAVP